ncbi:MAG: hypothetical protein OXC27_15615 [Caldilineaceae bacterium]|nr:hypothetical protein [Caldilineaceae bacterium]
MNVKVDYRSFEEHTTQQFHHQGAMPQQARQLASRTYAAAGKLAGDVPRMSSRFLLYEAGPKNWSTSYGV